MYRRKQSGLSEEEMEIARYGLPPKYDGNRFRRDPEPEEYKEDEAETVEETVVAPSGPGADRRGLERLKRELGARLGSEELFIIALILILSGPHGDEGESASDVILLLALLLTVGGRSDG